MHSRGSTIADHMTASPHSIGADQVLGLAHEMMRTHRIRHLPVLSGGRLVGIVSDRDLRLVESLKDVDPDEVPVEDAMTPEPHTVAPSAPLLDVVREMAEHKHGCAVVLDGGKVVGMFTTSDALRVLAAVLARPSPRRRSSAATRRRSVAAR